MTQTKVCTTFKVGDVVKITSDRIMAGRNGDSYLKVNGLKLGMVARIRCMLPTQFGYVDIGLQISKTHGAFVRDNMLTKL